MKKDWKREEEKRERERESEGETDIQVDRQTERQRRETEIWGNEVRKRQKMEAEEKIKAVWWGKQMQDCKRQLQTDGEKIDIQRERDILRKKHEYKKRERERKSEIENVYCVHHGTFNRR